MSQPTPVKIFWIGCSGDGYVTMREDRLQALLAMMPTLEFLLFGHPNMKPKELSGLEDGTQILEIPRELKVPKTSFILLVNCAFEVEPLPPRGIVGSRLTELVDTMTTLGGCDAIETRLSDHSANPLTPEEDTNDKFVWQIIQTVPYQTIDYYNARDMNKLGYTFTTSCVADQMTSHYYRKKNY